MATLPTYRSKRFGKRMRQLREETGLSLQAASEKLLVDQTTISRIENGKRGITRLLLKTAMDTYGVTDERHRRLLTDLAKSIRQQDWWDAQGPLLTDTLEEYLTLENDSRVSRVNELTVLPGLLQTEAYMRHMFKSRGEPERVEHLVNVRMKRKERLEDRDFTIQAVIDVCALRRIGGGEELRREQLDYLLQASGARNVTIQLMPLDIAWTPDQCGSFTLFTLEEDWPGDIVWVESLSGGSVMEQERDVVRFRRAWDELTATAMSPTDSERYIRRLLKEPAP